MSERTAEHTSVPFVDLRAQYHSIKPEIDRAVIEVFESTQFVLGSFVADFEQQFAAYTSADHAIGCNSGTSALHLAMLAAGIGRDDEVITTPSTFVATVSAIDYCGARPVFVDVEPDTLLIDPARIEERITERTKAIVPVHLHGLSADMDPIVEIAARRGLVVIEDAAQAHGAEYKGRRVGSIGEIGCFSFYPGKNLGAYGEGGAVTTNDPNVAHTVRVLRDWGSERRYHHDLKGFNYRLEGVQGAVLGVKMDYVEEWTEARRAVARRYNEAFAGSSLSLPVDPADRRHVFHVYAVRHENRDDLQKFLAERDIASGIHYPIPVHLQKAFAELGNGPGDFPIAERAADELLSLPMYPELGAEQQQLVIDAVLEWTGR